MRIDTVHQLHHHDSTGYIKTPIFSNHRCTNWTSCLYVPCFSVANVLTLQTYFSTSLRIICSVMQSLRFLWLLCRNIKSEKFCPGIQQKKCVVVETLQRKCHRIAEFGLFYLKTSLPATWKASKVQKCQPTWSNIGKTEGMLSKTWEVNSFLWRNIEKPFGFIWYLLWTWENLLLRDNSCFDGMFCTLYAICSSHSRRSTVSHLEH